MTLYVDPDTNRLLVKNDHLRGCCCCPAGACCKPDGTCDEMCEADCADIDGVWFEGEACPDPCPRQSTVLGCRATCLVGGYQSTRRTDHKDTCWDYEEYTTNTHFASSANFYGVRHPLFTRQEWFDAKWNGMSASRVFSWQDPNNITRHATFELVNTGANVTMYPTFTVPFSVEHTVVGGKSVLICKAAFTLWRSPTAIQPGSCPSNLRVSYAGVANCAKCYESYYYGNFYADSPWDMQPYNTPWIWRSGCGGAWDRDRKTKYNTGKLAFQYTISLPYLMTYLQIMQLNSATLRSLSQTYPFTGFATYTAPPSVTWSGWNNAAWASTTFTPYRHTAQIPLYSFTEAIDISAMHSSHSYRQCIAPPSPACSSGCPELDLTETVGGSKLQFALSLTDVTVT